MKVLVNVQRNAIKSRQSEVVLVLISLVFCWLAHASWLLLFRRVLRKSQGFLALRDLVNLYKFFVSFSKIPSQHKNQYYRLILKVIRIKKSVN